MSLDHLAVAEDAPELLDVPVSRYAGEQGRAPADLDLLVIGRPTVMPSTMPPSGRPADLAVQEHLPDLAGSAVSALPRTRRRRFRDYVERDRQVCPTLGCGLPRPTHSGTTAPG